MVEHDNNESREFAIAIAKIARDNNSRNVQVLNLSGKSPATDYFVVATSTSQRQARTVSDEINNYSKKVDYQRFGQAGYEAGRWILLDFVNVVVHIFDDEYRDYYQIERLWGDAEVLKFEN